MNESERAAKRVKISDKLNELAPPVSANRSKHSQGQKNWSRSVPKSSKSKPSPKVSLFARPSVISPGDRGIFVTSDKGREKKALLEFHNLLEYHFQGDENGLGKDSRDGTSLTDQMVETQSSSIENDIEAELEDLKGGETTDTSGKAIPSQKWQLITLDIPCVSFVRFHTKFDADPGIVVLDICNRAMADKTMQPRTRSICRLTPISVLAKTLSDGLARVCDEVLPGTFAIQDEQTESSRKTFAIRPSIRNNDKVKREEVIEAVATKVQELGQGKHKVDLKNYQKGILIEIYRNWVGICVVDNSDEKGRPGYEALRKYNLAEIQARAILANESKEE